MMSQRSQFLLHPRINPSPENFDLKRQSVAVPGTKRPGQTHVYRNAAFGLFTLEDPKCFKTLAEVFDEGYKLAKDKPCLGYRKQVSQDPLQYADHYSWITYAEVDVRRRCIGSAIDALFKSGVLSVENGLETVGLWSPNRPEWQMIDFALHAYNKVGVALYDTLGENSVEYIIGHAHLSIIFAEARNIHILLKLAHKLPFLKMIVSMDDLSPDMKSVLTHWSHEKNIQVLDLREFEAQGKKNLIEPLPVTSETIATICYTSGTTSTPKGVVLTHGNLAAAIYSNLFGLELPKKKDLVVYSLLPLAHIYERSMDLCATGIGLTIAYNSGSPLRVLEDLQILKPHYFPAVPRILNRIYQAAMSAGDSPGLKGTLFKRAVKTKLDELHATGYNAHPLWDRLIFKKIQTALGGNLSFVTSGSAPLNPDVFDFLRISLVCNVVQGYGMTENCGTCLRTATDDPSAARSVGAPQPVNEVKLIDVPEMGYTSEDKPNPRGELLVRGENCFKYYYKDEESTKMTIDEEGFIHTGDVVELDECGRLSIIDRVKNIMKLSQGEYVPLESVENKLCSCPIVAQLFIYGDSLQSYLLGVVVPDPVGLAALASRIYARTIQADDQAALAKAVKDPKIVKAILDLLTKEGIQQKLKGFEMIKRIHVTLSPFTVEDDTLTPTFKLRRRDCYNKYKAELDALYALGEPQSSGSIITKL